MRARRWLVIGLVVVVVPVIIWALLQTPTPGRGGGDPVVVATPRPQPTPTPSPAIPPVRVAGTTITTVDPSGLPQWDLRAAAVVVDGTAGTVALTTVTGVFFEAGEPSVEFTAPRGTFFIASRNVALEGGVRARASTGRTLEADAVRWIPGNRQIEARGNVVLRQEALVVRADRLTSDTTLQHSRLRGNIRVTVVE